MQASAQTIERAAKAAQARRAELMPEGRHGRKPAQPWDELPEDVRYRWREAITAALAEVFPVAESPQFDPHAYPLDLPEDAPDYWASYDAYWANVCTTEHPCPVRALHGRDGCDH